MDLYGQVVTSWFRDAIVYHILVDRFAGYGKNNNPQKPNFIGGNIKGIAGKLPYLIELGINTLWLSPVYESTAYHGYHITDFYSTDKRFGTEKDLKHLIHLCHKNNIRVLLDFVPNHCSSQHPYFREALANKHSKYRKWFYFSGFQNKYLCFLHYRDLPKINLEYPGASSHITGAARHWLQLGVDGFRLDHAIGPSHKFWKTFRSETKLVNPEALLIGEAWLEGMNFKMLKTVQIRRKYLRWLFRYNPWNIAQEYIGEMDGVLDFYFRHRITEFIAWKDNPEQHEELLRKLMNDYYKRFPDNYYLPSFIDNHDMNRFLFDAGQNREKLKMALKFQFSLPQPPILYYGTETGLSHTEGMHWNIPFSDIQARQPMPWDKLDKELIDFCKELISDRKKDPRTKI